MYGMYSLTHSPKSTAETGEWVCASLDVLLLQEDGMASQA
jgi:hypothetical protein